MLDKIDILQVRENKLSSREESFHNKETEVYKVK